MGANPKNLIYDGWLQLIACNGSERPLSVPRNQVHRAVNCVFRKDEPGPRPGFQYRGLTFRDSVDQSLFNTGRWQGAMVYTPGNKETFHLVAKGGRLWKVEIFNNFLVTDVTIQVPHTVAAGFIAPVIGGSITVILSDVAFIYVDQIIRINGAPYQVVTVDSTLNQVGVTNLLETAGTVHAIGEVVVSYDLNESTFFKNWMIQAEKWALIQDGFNRCIIFDGNSARRSGSLEVPIGTAMTYGLGRVWLANSDKDGFAGSDLIYGPSGTPAEGFRDSILKFTENTWLAGGGWFSVPEESGDITGMKFIANLDVVLGQGPLQVFTENGSFSVKVPANRLQWASFGYDSDGTVGANSIDPIQTVSLKSKGSAGADSIIAVNSDFYFRSSDGIRSFQLSRRQFGTWANTPIGQAVDWVLDLDQQELLQYSSAVLFDRRYICTAAPQVEDRGVVHKGLVSLDFEQSNWTDQRPPDWDGLWTVSFAYQIIAGIHKGKDRCFYYTRNLGGDVELYELDANAHTDQADATFPTKIRWMFETGEIAFPTEQAQGYFDMKQLFGGEIRVTQMEDEVEFKLRWKPDNHPCWFVWEWWEECAPVGAECDYINQGECRDWSSALPQSRPAMGIPQPPDYCDSNGMKARNFYTIQLRLDVRGYCKLNAIRLAAMQLDQPVIARLVECKDA